MLVLSAARGGRLNTYYGDMALLDGADRAWFAKAQRLYYPLQARGDISLFGENPGGAQPYGFLARGDGGAVCTVVNPAATEADVLLPPSLGAGARILFTDAGRPPELAGETVRLGPGQLAVVGSGEFADPRWDLGVQDDVLIPSSSEPLPAVDVMRGSRSIAATVAVPRTGTLRIMCSQSATDGRPWRVTGGPPPSGIPLGRLLVLKAEQGGRQVTLRLNYDRQIWSGLSWAVADVPARELDLGMPVRITYEIDDPKGNSGVPSIRAYAVSP
jgi:hypothetical protein